MGMPVICASKTPLCQAKTDIIESIALQEAALAHILNAEGEKIQKVVACSRNICDLLNVNKSVESMVKSVTGLEQVLSAKLELILKETCR